MIIPQDKIIEQLETNIRLLRDSVTRLELEIFELKGDNKILKGQIKESTLELQNQQGYYDGDGFLSKTQIGTTIVSGYGSVLFKVYGLKLGGELIILKKISLNSNLEFQYKIVDHDDISRNTILTAVLIYKF